MKCIKFRYVTDAYQPSRVFKYKTLNGARRKARKLVGYEPKRDPDGYAVDRKTGNCLFILEGTTFEELFWLP